MVKQPKASRYAKDTDRINEMKEVFEMFHIQHLREIKGSENVIIFSDPLIFLGDDS